MPGSGEAASYGDLLTTSLLVLGGVCVAAFVVVRVLGRFLATGPRRGGHLLDVVARVPLEPRRSLYVVDVAGKTLLVGTSEMGLSVLTELDRDAVKSRVVERPTFAEMVRNAWVKRRGRSSEEPAGASALENASHAIEMPESNAGRDSSRADASVASDTRGSSEKPESKADARRETPGESTGDARRETPGVSNVDTRPSSRGSKADMAAAVDSKAESEHG